MGDFVPQRKTALGGVGTAGTLDPSGAINRSVWVTWHYVTRTFSISLVR